MTGLRAYHNKRDTIEKGLVALMRGLGMSVFLINKPCDAIVGWRGANHLVDFKSKPKKGLTKDQADFDMLWRGEKIWIIRTDKDVHAMRVQIVTNEATKAEQVNRRNRTITVS